MKQQVFRIDVVRGCASIVGTYDAANAMRACYGLFANAAGDKSAPLQADWHHDGTVTIGIFSRGDQVLGFAGIATVR
jgi:hypothetical protein